MLSGVGVCLAALGWECMRVWVLHQSVSVNTSAAGFNGLRSCQAGGCVIEEGLARAENFAQPAGLTSIAGTGGCVSAAQIPAAAIFAFSTCAADNLFVVKPLFNERRRGI